MRSNGIIGGQMILTGQQNSRLLYNWTQWSLFTPAANQNCWKWNTVMWVALDPLHKTADCRSAYTQAGCPLDLFQWGSFLIMSFAVVHLSGIGRTQCIQCMQCLFPAQPLFPVDHSWWDRIGHGRSWDWKLGWVVYWSRVILNELGYGGSGDPRRGCCV